MNKPIRTSAKRAARKRGPAEYRPVPGRVRFNTIPTDDQLANIPMVPVTEFELNDKETRRLRSKLYAINHDMIRRYRTLREGNILLVWRIQ